MLTCIGIDDEEHCNRYLKECCDQISNVNLVKTFTDPFAAVTLLATGTIEVLFLDFNLRSIIAPDFILHVPASVKVVIISSEMERTILAYNMKIAGILHKPYTCQSLSDTCKKLTKKSRQ
ncbi:response regulator [Mucilaginibacter rubeus]|uniref:Response regulator n=1 Tax=Mucilaginibacter rubeus TaxID=2027860 RepID=A0AAE6JKQ0_9SPHI|nr:response regulator [Mucilaginibacter rubeus]QEM20261.1 response regulator [Mucilaginibacter gossypii]